MSEEIASTASGIALMYGADGNGGWKADELTTRLMVAMESDDIDEVEHVTALMVGKMVVRGIESGDRSGSTFCADQWMKTFHAEE